VLFLYIVDQDAVPLHLLLDKNFLFIESQYNLIRLSLIPISLLLLFVQVYVLVLSQFVVSFRVVVFVTKSSLIVFELIFKFNQSVVVVLQFKLMVHFIDLFLEAGKFQCVFVVASFALLCIQPHGILLFTEVCPSLIRMSHKLHLHLVNQAQ